MTKKIHLDQSTKINEELLYSPTPVWLPIDLTTINATQLHNLPLSGSSLTLVCGVSTAGKDTLVRAVLQKNTAIHYLPRATSRTPRPGERDGVDYFFSIEDPLVWSEYGGNIYAITDQVLKRLAQAKNCIQVQGLLYGFVLQKILQPYGVTIQIVYVLPELLTKNMLGSLRIVLDRLYELHPEQADARLPSIVRELKFIFEYQDELKAKGVHFLENPPTTTPPVGLLMESLQKGA